MASSFEKSVKGATKHKCAAPKAKYVEHILIATHAGEAGIAEVFRALSIRLRESSWTSVFKALIVVHYMIREGELDVTLKFVRRNPRVIALTHYSDAQLQGRNIRNYSFYLNERARTYGEVRTDYVRSGEGRLRKLSVEKGLLREVECIQTQIRALLKCTFLDGDVDNEITLLAFRLLVSDLLVLFHVVNEGVINVLEHYFEMSRYDAERALEIYKVFTKQTADVVDYLQQARVVEPSTRLQIPNIKHAPTSLTSSLEEYLHDPDFDINRRQYLAQQEAKKTGSRPKTAGASTTTLGKTSPAQNGPRPMTASQPEPPKPKEQPKVAPDLIDFFESIETEQTPMFTDAGQQQQPQPQVSQQTGMLQQGLYQQPGGSFAVQPQSNVAPQIMPSQTGGPYPTAFHQTNPFPQIPQPMPQPMPAPVQPVQTHFTGAGFGGFTPQDQQPNVSAPPMPIIPQQFVTSPPQATGISFPQQPAALQIPSQTGTNPFRQSTMVTGAPTMSPSYATSPPPLPTQQGPKSTNPFARNATPPTTTPTSQTTTPTFSPGLAPQLQQPLTRSVTSANTNPFARNVSPQATGGATLSVNSHPTGTNPFRASMMVQQQQAQQMAQMNGNFSGQTGTLGGLENVETVPVFPRSQQQQPGWGQQ